jgi:DNA-binding transcriptional MerR regulator
MDIITQLRPVDVARTFHRSADWLKKLEADGIIPAAARDFSGRRIYTPEDVERIRDILERRRGGRAA